MTVARGPAWPDGPAPDVGLHVLAYVCRAAYALGDLPESKDAAEHVRWFSAFLHGAGPPTKP